MSLFYQIIKRKLDTLLLQKPDRVEPLFGDSIVREYEKKKVTEDEVKKDAAYQKRAADYTEYETVEEKEEKGEEEEEREVEEEEEENETEATKTKDFDKLNAMPDEKLLLALQRINPVAPEIRYGSHHDFAVIGR